MSYPVRVRVELIPIWHQDPPEIRIGIDQAQPTVLDSARTFDYDFTGHGKHRLIIELTNKRDSDTDLSRGLDKAVIIKSIEFFGIQDQRFVWAGTYRPDYPEPWYSQQTTPPTAVLNNQDRLSWNGRWELEFEVPVFTWMHGVLDLGWIYD